MAEKEYIDREAFVEQKRKQYCEDCNRRKGFKRGQYKILYEIGEAPCRACEIDDMLNDVEDFPAADVRPVVRGKWKTTRTILGLCCICSVCESCANTESRFCPYCGADMREA